MGMGMGMGMGIDIGMGMDMDMDMDMDMVGMGNSWAIMGNHGREHGWLCTLRPWAIMGNHGQSWAGARMAVHTASNPCRHHATCPSHAVRNCHTRRRPLASSL
eukprot:6562498-Prymnesium_polylepis.1